MRALTLRKFKISWRAFLVYIYIMRTTCVACTYACIYLYISNKPIHAHAYNAYICTFSIGFLDSLDSNKVALKKGHEPLQNKLNHNKLIHFILYYVLQMHVYVFLFSFTH